MKTLLLIDINSIIHRCFHAIPLLTSPAGQPVNALYGLSSTLLKIIREEKPDFIAAAFDRPEPTFREELYPEYKIQRPKVPGELAIQIKMSRKLLQKFKMKFFEKSGFEADDILGSLANLFSKYKDLKIVILTGDLDALQLVRGEKIVVRTPQKGLTEMNTYDRIKVKSRLGIFPEQIPDFKALVGDVSDNLPGIPGVGPKTAAILLNQFGDLDGIYKNFNKLDNIVSPKVCQSLKQLKSQALLVKKLASIRQDLKFDLKLDHLAYQIPRADLINYFRKLGFNRLISRLEKFQGNQLNLDT